MSNSGYPEGCATSCFAMGLADLVFHLYLRAYAQTTIPISYVDNFELLASNCGQLQRGILCTEEWSQMWQMSLDREKSYVWATSAQLRQECQVLGWDLKETAVDLGANMVYGKKHRVSGAVDRMNSVGPLWDLVKRLPAPEWKKLQMLRQCIWPKEFFWSGELPPGEKACARSSHRSNQEFEAFSGWSKSSGCAQSSKLYDLRSRLLPVLDGAANLSSYGMQTTFHR